MPLIVSFFWNPGGTLQKSIQGLLRSLLFQILDQQPETISIMMSRKLNSEETRSDSFSSMQIHVWTEERLLSVLKHFLNHKPSSISILFFIDGLDEYVGDEDNLIETLRLLISTPHVKVCVSSRPEQIFRREFSMSSQLRLQDLNRKDIERTVKEKLLPVLEQCFPQEKFKIDRMMEVVISKAQGIFLWLELSIKDLRKGVYNADTMSELYARLQSIPDPIEGLYENMLSHTDKQYMQEAIEYFQRLMLDSHRPISLLEFACAEDVSWAHVAKNDGEYLRSSEFYDTCQNYETRIVTRCAGLIEIEEHTSLAFHDFLCQYGFIVNKSRRIVDINHENQSSFRHYRKVRFIHRTAVDFLEIHRQEFFQQPNWRARAILSLARGNLGLMSMLPFAKAEGLFGDCLVRNNEPFRVSMGFFIEDFMDELHQLDEIISTEGVDDSLTSSLIEMGGPYISDHRTCRYEF